MGKPSDYKCDNCGSIREIFVKFTDDFPKNIPCYKCGEEMRRVFAPAYKICHQGKTGNAKNGYTSNPGHVKKT
jgi:predicted nucleic acid-binding Zn ribbon protein